MATLPDLDDRANWPTVKERLAAVFRTRTRDQWCALLEGSDACFAPVLAPLEAREHPHNRARGTFVEIDGVVQPAPAPRFSRTPPGLPEAPRTPGPSGIEAAVQWGVPRADLQSLIERGVLVNRGA